MFSNGVVFESRQHASDPIFSDISLRKPPVVPVTVPNGPAGLW